MSENITIAAAGSVMPAALAELRKFGYVITLTNNGRLCKAENGELTFVAEDMLLLLGLIKLHEARGHQWSPTEVEVDEYLEFDAARAEVADERTAVWEECGSVHVLCVSAYGDPVELGESEARDFANRLSTAIAEAGPK